LGIGPLLRRAKNPRGKALHEVYALLLKIGKTECDTLANIPNGVGARAGRSLCDDNVAERASVRHAGLSPDNERHNFAACEFEFGHHKSAELYTTTAIYTRPARVQHLSTLAEKALGIIYF